MKGLFRNNFFAVWINAKVFLIFMLLFAIVVTIIPEQTLQMYFIMIGIVGFSVIAATAIGNEFSLKWGKYKLTLPVKRTDIVRSLFLNQIFWTIVGTLFTGIVTGLSYMIQGFSFDQFSGIFSLFILAVSISFFMGAIFIPMIYLTGEDKIVVFLIISLFCAVSIAAMLFNIPLFGNAIIITCALMLFAVSYPLTISIFKRKEF
ncbi:ABC-2 transporter permease [bacterium 0.1xD8-71]|jgi:hypothetical protein|nr:ABC-2 transporter permease [bacterium 0.1xD8-71]